jgi:hypothetical protein
LSESRELFHFTALLLPNAVNVSRPHRFPRYGFLGLLLIAFCEVAIVAEQSGWWPSFPWWRITAWTTPACWWGYIFLVDAWVYRRDGQSWLRNRRDLFVLQCILSVVFWCLFEGYNRLMPGWRYVGLPPTLQEEFVGYIIAFATIMPGMFVTARLLKSYGVFRDARMPRVRWTRNSLRAVMVFGLLCVTVPPFLSLPPTSGWWGLGWAAVWSGWVFFLDPINYRRGGQSIFRDWEDGRLGRTLQLFTAGAICGLLWEFWNFWAYSKWEYTFNVARDLKFFEMPVAGFLGFMPFAMEFFVMFHFVALFFTREDKLGL